MIKTNDQGWMTVNAEPMMWAMVNAIQELSAKVTALEAQI